IGEPVNTPPCESRFDEKLGFARSQHSSRQYRECASGCIHLVTHARLRRCIKRQVDVNPRTETDETEALPARQPLTRSGIAQDTAGDQTCDLNTRNVRSARSRKPKRGALVFER